VVLLSSSWSTRSTPSQRAVARNLGLDLVAATGIGVTMGLVAALLPTIARRAGLDPLGLGALAAAPFVANLLGAFAGRLGPRSTRQLAVIRAGGATSLVALLALQSSTAMIAVVVVFWLSISLTGPFHLRLWGAMYPPAIVGRVVGVIGMGRAAAAALAAFAGGIIADHVGGPSAMAIAGVAGVLCAVAYAGLRAASDEGPRRYSARESIRALRDRPVLGRVALAQGFYGGGLIAAVPLYALVNVDRLNLSLADVGIIGILMSAATTVSFPIWGMVADRRGPLTALRTGSSFGVAGLIGYAFAPSAPVVWGLALALGTASASIDVGIAAIVSKQTPLSERAAAMAGWNAVTGARGIVAAFTMSALLSLGVVNVTAGLLICALSAATGVVLFTRVDASSREAVPLRQAATRPVPLAS
jgi:MFS transporter, DHA1 family, staphyloferrin B biosynthesis exporter